jgi:enterochelin esterase-like enzyme
MTTKESKYPVLAVSEGKVYIDGNRIRAVTDYAIERGDIRKPYAVLHLTVSIDPKLSINNLGKNLGGNVLDKVQGESPDF